MGASIGSAAKGSAYFAGSAIMSGFFGASAFGCVAGAIAGVGFAAASGVQTGSCLA